MGLFDSLFGGGNKTQTTTQTPWAPLQPYLSGEGGIFSEAQRLYQQGPQQYYPGQTYAGFDPLQQQSQQLGIDYATSGLGGLLDPTMASLQNVVSGGLMSPDSNPYLAQNIQNMADVVRENMALSGISQNEDVAQTTGQYGSSRHGLADYLTRKSANEAIARNTADMLMGGYNTGLNAMMQGIGLTPQISQLGMAPSNLLSTIGGERQGMTQQGITEDVNRFNFNQMAPWQNLQNYAGSLQGNYMGSGGTTTSPVTGSNPFGGILGGLGAGAGVMQALGSTNPMWLAGGGLLGLLGSR